MKRNFGFSTAVLLACACWPASRAHAQFPPLGDDRTNSLGQFEFVVNPAFQAAVTNFPGWNSTTSRLWSPVLFDSSTTMGRSSPFLSGSATDKAGAPVGTAGTVVADASFQLVPRGFRPPAGTREVHTELRALDLSGGGLAVRAGTNAPNQRKSVGSANSLSGSGLPANDFPAQGFFDVFIELDLPGLGTLSNSTPLVLLSSNLTAFPPRAIYVAGNASAVALLFETNNPSVGANAGDIFGFLLVAGQGVSMDSNDLPTFQTNVQSQAELPVLPQYQTWAPGLSVIPVITSINTSFGYSTIQGQGAARQVYVLETTTNLTAGNWAQAGSVLANTSGNFGTTFGPSSARYMFFRVRSQ